MFITLIMCECMWEEIIVYIFYLPFQLHTSLNSLMITNKQRKVI